MGAYFARRLLLMIPTFLGVTMLVFAITRIVPGGPLEKAIREMKQGSLGGGETGGGGAATLTDPAGEIPKEALEELKRAYDLDKPGYIAYFHWLGRVVTLDLGNSYTYRKPVTELVFERFPISLTFGLTGFIMAYLVCIPLGIYKALRHGSAFDLTSSTVVFMGYSIPGWAFGALLLVLFASGRFFDWFPLGGFHSTSWDSLPSVVQEWEDQDEVSNEFGDFVWEKMTFPGRAVDLVYHMALPVLCYMMGQFAVLTVLMKNSLMENLGQDYVRTGFAKGLSERRVIFLHTLRNSLIPLATGLGHALSVMMAGSYLIEWVFNIDGLGYLGYTSIVGRDYTVVMGVLVINTALALLGNIFSDLLYALIDPRIRFE